MFLVGKLPQLRTDFRQKGCPNFLYQDGRIAPQFLHLGNFGKFQVVVGILNSPKEQTWSRKLWILTSMKNFKTFSVSFGHYLGYSYSIPISFLRTLTYCNFLMIFLYFFLSDSDSGSIFNVLLCISIVFSK